MHLRLFTLSAFFIFWGGACGGSTDGGERFVAPPEQQLCDMVCKAESDGAEMAVSFLKLSSGYPNSPWPEITGGAKLNFGLG